MVSCPVRATLQGVRMEPMSDTEIVDCYRRDGYVVVDNVVDDADLDPMRDFIAAAVDQYASEQHARGDLASLHADEPFERRYAAICEEQGISPRDSGFGTFGPAFYGLYTHPGILRIVGLLLGEEVSVIASPSLRQKLPGSAVTSFPWHQDSHYFDQTEVQRMEKHTEDLHMVSVWVPLVPATVENGCCWVIPGSHRWGLLDAMRGEDRNVRMSEDVEARGTPVPVPVPVGGAFFFTNLTVHASKQNRTRGCRWSVDFRYMPTPSTAGLDDRVRRQAEFIENGCLAAGDVPFAVLPEESRPTWPQWEAAVGKHQASMAA